MLLDSELELIRMEPSGELLRDRHLLSGSVSGPTADLYANCSHGFSSLFVRALWRLLSVVLVASEILTHLDTQRPGHHY